MSRICTLAMPATALRIVLLNVFTTVLRAQLTSLFQTPQPPIVWRVKPVSG